MDHEQVEQTIKDILHDRVVLVTGADGFVGSHLVEKLLEYGSRVHVLVRATSSGMLHNLGPVQQQITIHRGDLADKTAVEGVVRKLKRLGGRVYGAAAILFDCCLEYRLWLPDRSGRAGRFVCCSLNGINCSKWLRRESGQAWRGDVLGSQVAWRTAVTDPRYARVTSNAQIRGLGLRRLVGWDNLY